MPKTHLSVAVSFLELVDETKSKHIANKFFKVEQKSVQHERTVPRHAPVSKWGTLLFLLRTNLIRIVRLKSPEK